MPLKRPTTTPLPDEIYDEWAPRLGEAELKVLLYIVRRTLGFRKGADAISLNQFLRGIVTRDGRELDHGCGVKSRPNVVRALKKLEEKGLIRTVRVRTTSGDSDVTTYALWWEAQEDGTLVPEGGVATKPGGGVERTPRWFRSDPEVVSEQHHGGVATKPTTNSDPTNSQHDRDPTGTMLRETSDQRWVARQEPVERDQVPTVDADTVWRAVLEEVRQTTTARNYDRWFAPTIGTNLDGHDLTVVVPTEMHRSWLDVRLRPRIDDTLRLLRYTDVRVTFMVATNDNQNACARARPPWREREDTRRRELP